MKPFTTKFINQEKLPLVIEPVNPKISFDSFLKMIREHNAYFKEEMLKVGGLLFRGFPINSPEDFQKTIETLDTGKMVDYIGGGSPRNKVKNSVYTSTEAPSSIRIHLHNEMSFTKNFPKHIFFYCDTPPESGGETYIGDARRIYKDIDPEVRKKFEEKGLKYVSRYYKKDLLIDLINQIQRGHKTWMQVFETESKEEVEKRCRENDINFKWNKNNWLEINRIRPATIKHPVTQEDIWFNQVHLFDYNPRFVGWLRYLGMRLVYSRPNTLVDEMFYADDTKISRKEMYHVHDVLDKNSIYFPWKKGDMMALDNILTMHARAPFKGKRRILTAMTTH